MLSQTPTSARCVTPPCEDLCMHVVVTVRVAYVPVWVVPTAPNVGQCPLPSLMHGDAGLALFETSAQLPSGCNAWIWTPAEISNGSPSSAAHTTFATPSSSPKASTAPPALETSRHCR